MDLDIYQSSYMVDYQPYGKDKYSRVTPQEVRSHPILSSVQWPTEIIFTSFLLCVDIGGTDLEQYLLPGDLKKSFMGMLWV